jgi:hypothetical protein
MADHFLHYDPNNPQEDGLHYDDDETEDDGFDFTTSVPTFPFFQTSDPALRAAYSYGDPRGGSYPDPTIHQLRSSAPPENILTSEDFSGRLENQTENDDLTALLGTIPIEDPERDPDFGTSDVEDDESSDGTSAGEVDGEDEAIGRQGSLKPTSAGRGRGGGKEGNMDPVLMPNPPKNSNSLMACLQKLSSKKTGIKLWNMAFRLFR